MKSKGLVGVGGAVVGGLGPCLPVGVEGCFLDVDVGGGGKLVVVVACFVEFETGGGEHATGGVGLDEEDFFYGAAAGVDVGHEGFGSDVFNVVLHDYFVNAGCGVLEGVVADEGDVVLEVLGVVGGCLGGHDEGVVAVACGEQADGVVGHGQVFVAVLEEGGAYDAESLIEG